MSDAGLRISRLEDELPEGPVDLVSALAVRQLGAAGKRWSWKDLAVIQALRGN